MQRRLALSFFDGLSLLGCRRSIGLWPVHLLSYGHRRELSDSPAATDPRWLLLNRHGLRGDGSSVADASTAADSHTFEGRHLRVSFCLEAPPASSFLYYDLPDGDEDDDDDDKDYGITVVAAHGDSVLLQMNGTGRRLPPSYDFCVYDYFVYRAGATGVRPPSLSLLPAREFTTKNELRVAEFRLDRPLSRSLDERHAGILRRGDDELMVVELEIMYDRTLRRDMAGLCVLRVSSDGWEIKQPVPIIQSNGDHELPYHRHGTETGFPVGDRFLCWVDYTSGFLLCDMAEEATPKFWYVPLPHEVMIRYSDDHEIPPMEHSRGMGAAGADAVKFVSIDTRCCCGGPGRSTCEGSRVAFTVTTWTMNIGTDEPMTWVKDDVLECEELWALPGYEGLPHAHLECPVVSLDKPNIVCFLVSNHNLNVSYEDWKEWMVEIDMKNKAIMSAVEFDSDSWRAYHHLPAKLQC
ncbi:hypothetical protein ACP70R_022547 [Stipagrostis hirtigluma subsp. patula]